VSKSRRGLTDDEEKLWRRVAASVKARRHAAEPEETPVPQTGAKQAHAAKPTPASPKPRTSAPAGPQDRGAERRVRRGQLAIAATLDLHGHTQDTGRAALARFLRAAHEQGARTVVVITGVGRTGHGVLKRRLPEWLAEGDLRPLVSGFAQAHRAHGGEGAYYVFLRRERTT
jgi:DNA-nicking Smr family endonuclease